VSNPVHVQMFLRVVRRRVLLPQLRHRTHLIIALLPELATSLSQLSVVSSSVARDVARRKSIVTCFCSLCVRAAVHMLNTAWRGAQKKRTAAASNCEDKIR
jgi:hypothetical protein